MTGGGTSSQEGKQRLTMNKVVPNLVPHHPTCTERRSGLLGAMTGRCRKHGLAPQTDPPPLDVAKGFAVCQQQNGKVIIAKRPLVCSQGLTLHLTCVGNPAKTRHIALWGQPRI